MNVCVFDIETIPDTRAAAKLYGFDGLNDADIADALFSLRRQQQGSSFLPHYLQQIVAISIVLYGPEQVKVWSLGEESSSEAEIIERFFHGIDKLQPTLVSWNGSGFDLPVLHYRALLYGICAETYWENGDKQSNFRYNNYLNRYHERHLDIMDVLSAYQARATAPLDKIAIMLDCPGKMGMSGKQVWQAYQAGEIKAIRDYCETDVLNTFLVFLRLQLMRGKLTQANYTLACDELYAMLAEQTAPHLQTFLQHWRPTQHV